MVGSLIAGLSDDAEDVVLAHDQVILIVDFDFGAAVFRDQHLVALLHREIDFLSLVIDFTGAESDHFPLLWFFLGGIGDDDPAFFHFLLFNRLHQHPISERFYINCCHRLFSLLLLVLFFGLSRRSSASAPTTTGKLFDYFFLSSSTTSNSASTTSPSRLPAPSSAPPPRDCASGPGCGPGRGPACADACL